MRAWVPAGLKKRIGRGIDEPGPTARNLKAARLKTRAKEIAGRGLRRFLQQCGFLTLRVAKVSRVVKTGGRDPAEPGLKKLFAVQTG